MRIGINARFLIKNKLEGIGVFTAELCSRLAKLMPEHTFYFYFDRAFDTSFISSDNIIGRKILPSARHPFLWKIWFDVALPYYLKKDKIDVFFSTDGYCSLTTTVPQILTIHDIAFEHYPEYIPKLHAKYMQYYTPKYIEKAQKIITVSNFSKQDIIQKYGVDASKIDVIYNAFWNCDKAKPPTSIQIDSPYFIFVGAIHPRKNVLNLVKAFELFKQKTNSHYKLVLVGRDAWQNNAFKNILKTSLYKNDIIWIKTIERTELIELLKNAYALTYLSWFEGFGIPLVEAMTFGVPIVASNTSSIPEIAGNAALYCSPNQLEEIAHQLEKIVNDKSLYQTLKNNALERNHLFSWDKSAEQLSVIIRKIISKQ